MSKTLPDMYTVEKIIDKRLMNGKVQYLVKWEDYSESDNTWEPLTNLESVDHLIDDYEKRHKKRVRKPDSLRKYLNS